MSKVKIKGNASGTGVLTIEAPNTNTDRTITLPDEDITLGATGANAALSNLSGVTGTSGQVMTSDGSGGATMQDAAGGGFTSASETAGTALPVTYGSIPAGVSQIIVLFHDCDANSNEDVRVQLGDAGGIESSGYYSATHTQDASTGQSVYNAGAFDIKLDSGSDVLRAALTLYHIGSNKWVMTQMGISDSGVIVSGGGSKTLSAELTQIKIQTPYTTFSAGTVNIMYQ